jgi:hypothetical protein
MFHLAVIIIPLTFLATPLGATTWYVPSQCPTIQAGIDAAAPGDTVEVACGTYTWTSQGTATIDGLITMRSGICLRSETGEPDCVTIDAEGLGRVLYCSDLGLPTQVEGFTITGGGNLVGSYPDDFGGGIHCFRSLLQLSHCVVRNNDVTPNGSCGGMFIDAGGGRSPEVTDCVFEMNVAKYDGGGIGCAYGPMTLTRCAIARNHSILNSGGLDLYGSNSMVTDCQFLGNTGQYGAGVQLRYGSYPIFTGCAFAGNASSSHGGGMKCSDSQPTLQNCVFSGNSGHYGGAIYGIRSTLWTTNCTLADNSAVYGGAIAGEAAVVPLEASILWDNCATIWGQQLYFVDLDSMADFDCCNVDTTDDWKGGLGTIFWSGGHNQFLNPLFCDPQGCLLAPTTSGDYSLAANSPCLDAPGCGLMGALGEGCGATLLTPQTWARVKARYR